MKDYKWAPAMQVIRNAIVLNTVMPTAAFTADLTFNMRETDQFHPFDYSSEVELQQRLMRIPRRCNYRSCGMLALWKREKEALIGALTEFIYDTNDLVQDFYNNDWNFAPGYKKPESIKYKLEPEDLVKKLFWPVHRAAHGLTK